MKLGRSWNDSEFCSKFLDVVILELVLPRAQALPLFVIANERIMTMSVITDRLPPLQEVPKPSGIDRGEQGPGQIGSPWDD